MKAADFGNFARVPTDADIAALKALSVTRVIIGSSWGTKAAQQIAACQPHFETQEYQFPEAIKPPVGEWWLDVEISPFHVPQQAEVRAACQSHPIGIYSSKSQWDALWPSWDIVAEFPWLQLWTANYGALPRPFKPYGGWTAPTMTQYQDTTDIGTGFEVDLSEYEEECEMKPQFVWCPDYAGGSVWFVGPSGVGWATTQTAINEIATLYQIPIAPTVSLSIAALHAMGG